MKKILLFLFMAVSMSLYAQRHIKGIQGIELVGGITSKSKTGSIYYSRYLSSKFYLKAGILSEFGKIKSVDGTTEQNVKVKFSTYYVDVLTHYSLFNIKDAVFINPGLGISAAYEKVGDLEYKQAQKGIIFGGVGGLEIETFFSDKFVLITNIQQRYYLKSSFGAARWNAGLGIKYMF